MLHYPPKSKKSSAKKSAAAIANPPTKLPAKAALRLKAKEKGAEALRREIMRGFEDIGEGRFSAASGDAELEAFSDDVIHQAKERHNASKK